MPVPVLTPKNHPEVVALFRSQVIGELLHATFENHGELIQALRKLSSQRFRPPDSEITRTFGVSTLERWYYAWKRGGLAALVPRPRSDRGRAQALTSEVRALVCDIKREHPTASAGLILRTLVVQGRLREDTIREGTLRRLFEQEGLSQLTRADEGGTHTRLRWEASHPGALWHGDVCHGPALGAEGHRVPLRIHALLDDSSRFVTALEARTSETEDDMLALFVAAIRHFGAPDTLYLDNGSTYSGQQLATGCARLKINLIHARPYDPQARGKMERFWRTLRASMLDHLDTSLSHQEVQSQLNVFLTRHYHDKSHASLLGLTPTQAWKSFRTRRVSDTELAEALTVRARRLVSRDGVVSLDGQLFELRQSFLRGRRVVIGHCLVDGLPNSVFAEHADARYELHPLNRKLNGVTRRPSPTAASQSSTPFNPNKPQDGE